MITVASIQTAEAEPWLLRKHYARRMCPITYAFGAYRGPELIGVVTYGTPVSCTLRTGVCGRDWSSHVLELNRLCCESTRNVASTLVGRSLRLLPKPSVVVSYADTSQNHVGYVYQATNFLYTGMNANVKDWRLKGMEHLHHATIMDLSRGQENRTEWMRERYGDDFYFEERSRKHRYVYLWGDKRQRRAMQAALKYQILPYPKGESQRYDATATFATQLLLL